MKREVNVPRTISIGRDDLLENATEPKVKRKKKERKIYMNSSGKSKVNWTPQILMDRLRCEREAQVEMKWKKQTRGLPNVMFQKWNEIGNEFVR